MVTGRGLAGVLREHSSPWLLYPVVVALVAANTINAGADIGAIAAALFACPSWLRRSSNSCRSACRLGEASLLARYLSPPS